MKNRFIYFLAVLALFSSEKLFAFDLSGDFSYKVTATASAPTGKGKVYASLAATDSPDWSTCSNTAQVSKSGSGNWWSILGGTQITNTLYLYAQPETAYQFRGWGTSETQTTELSTGNPLGVSFVSNESDAAVDWTKTRYAIFSPINYSITYDADGGNLSPSGSTQTYNIESTGTVKTASKTGYSFDGWKITTTGGNWSAVGEIVSAGSSLMGKFGNVELKALWTPLLADITISVSGLDSNDSAIFTVSNGTGVLYTVALSGSNPSVTIKDLPTGVNYTVKATSNWSWAYGDPDPTGYTFGLGSSGYTASFEYTKKSSVKKHDEQQKVNWK